MPKIHWLGTGLSAVPGLRRLIATDYDVVVWNRTTDKAQLAVGDLTSNIKKFDFDEFSSTLVAGDVAVSMLPGEWHVPVANACIAASAHFVSSSYILPEMRELDKKARSLGLMMVNEVGLDPGIDHLMAHWLIADYRASAAYDVNNDISFISYCGGIPKIPNDFRYKFSWSPLGVLKALRSPSKSIRDFENLETLKARLRASGAKLRRENAAIEEKAKTFARDNLIEFLDAQSNAQKEFNEANILATFELVKNIKDIPENVSKLIFEIGEKGRCLYSFLLVRREKVGRSWKS